MAQDYVYQIGADLDPLLAELIKVDKKMTDLAKSGAESFRKIEQQSGRSASQASADWAAAGVKIGAVSGVVQAVTNRLLELGAQLGRMAIQAGQESVQMAEQHQAAIRKLTNQLDGNAEAAEAVADRIGKKAAALGVDLNEALSLTTAFLPSVGSIDELEGILETVRGIAELDPMQGVQGARLILSELASGDTTSARERIELTKQETDLLKQYQDELGGVQGALTGMNEILARRGIEIDNLADSLQKAQSETTFALSQIQLAFGQPLAEQLQESLTEINEIMAEAGPDLEVAADAIGRAVSVVLDTVTGLVTDFLEAADSEQFKQIGETAIKLAGAASDFVNAIAGAEWPQSFLAGVNTVLDATRQILVTMTQIEVMADAEGAKQRAHEIAAARMGYGPAVTEDAIAAFESDPFALSNAGTAYKLGAAAVGLEFFGTAEDQARAAAAGQEAYTKTIMDAVAAIEVQAQKTEEAIAANQAVAESTEESSEAAEAQAEAMLGAGDAADEMSEDFEKAAGKLSDRLTKIQVDLADKLIKLEEEAAKKRAEITEEGAEERAEIEERYAQQILDINEQYQSRLADLGTWQSREADLREKWAKDEQDLARDTAQAKEDIERDYQRTIADIQEQFRLDARDAERNQDAIAFLRAQERKDQALDDAAETRDERLQDLEIETERRREELARRQEEERQAEQERFEEQRQQLEEWRQEQLDAAAEQRAQELEAQAAAEQEKLAKLGEWLTEQFQKEQAAAAKRIADLQTSMRKEMDILGEHGKKMVAERVSQMDEMMNTTRTKIQEQTGALVSFEADMMARINRIMQAAQQAMQAVQTLRAMQAQTASGGGQPGGPGAGMDSGNPIRPTRMAAGGPVWASRDYLVGEAGPELFRPAVNGAIVPNNRLMFSPPARVTGGNVDNSRRVDNPVIQVNDPAKLSPVQEMAIRQIIVDTLADVL